MKQVEKLNKVGPFVVKMYLFKIKKAIVLSTLGPRGVGVGAAEKVGGSLSDATCQGQWQTGVYPRSDTEKQ